MIVLLANCIVIAPYIRYFEGPCQSRLCDSHPGVCAWLAAFALLKLPVLDQFRQSLPVYLQNKLNWGLVNTVICAMVMFSMSRLQPGTEEDRARADSIRASSTVLPMTRRETFKYRLSGLALILGWVAVLVFFSPLGRTSL